jgi:lipid-A-disaccharide synthase-like uncharacterized protein
MEHLKISWILAFGFLAQSMFGLRILIQWWVTEKRKQVVSPSLFWKFSLAGSALFLLYGILRTDIVIILGQLIGYSIYIRNLQLKQDWKIFPTVLKVLLLAVPLFAIAWVARTTDKADFIDIFLQNWNAIFLTGLAGQLLLNIRFLYQLYYSERHKESLLPTGFWWISLSGSILIIIYSIYRRDPVLLVAQGLAIVPYIRNIVLSGGRLSNGLDVSIQKRPTD